MPVIDNVILSNEEIKEIAERCMDLVLNCIVEDDRSKEKIQQLIKKINEFIWIAFELGKGQNNSTIA